MKRQFSALAAALAVLIAAILFSANVREGILTAGSRCLTVLIPSLYLYSLLASFLIRSGGIAALGRLFGKRGKLWAVVLFSQIGGYPVGAGGIAALYRKRMISAQEARHAALFMVCAGPGFVISFVGAVYQSRQTGLLFFAA